MTRFFLYIFFASLFISCDDGDVIVTTFDFEDRALQQCQGSNAFLFFQINDAGTESLSARLAITEDIFIEEETQSFTINGTTNFANYRIYDGSVEADYFCNEVPPTSPPVTVEYIAESGIASTTVTLNFDDEDGLAFVDSDDPELEGTGDFDGDGIPNYYDFDDDGDNVPTILELDTENADGDNDPLTNPKDTDDDGIADHLDTDDDGDGILTIDEDADQDLNPTNDIDETSVGANYLNGAISISYNITNYREHDYAFSSDIRLILSNMSFVNGEEQITRETIDMGSILGIATGEVLRTPDFPED